MRATCTRSAHCASRELGRRREVRRPLRSLPGAPQHGAHSVPQRHKRSPRPTVYERHGIAATFAFENRGASSLSEPPTPAKDDRGARRGGLQHAERIRQNHQAGTPSACLSRRRARAHAKALGGNPCSGDADYYTSGASSTAARWPPHAAHEAGSSSQHPYATAGGGTGVRTRVCRTDAWTTWGWQP